MKVKTKRTICTVLGAVLLFTMFTVVGSMEMGTLSIRAGAAIGLPCEIMGAFLLWKAGVLKV